MSVLPSLFILFTFFVCFCLVHGVGVWGFKTLARTKEMYNLWT
jgi:hypothetical protein